MIRVYIISIDIVHSLNKQLLNIFRASEMGGIQRKEKVLFISPDAIPGV